MLSLFQRSTNGQLLPVQNPLSPSLPCPVVRVLRFEIENLRKDPEIEYNYLCDLSIEGTLTSSICDLIPGSSGVIEEVRLIHNHYDKPLGLVSVQFKKTCSGDWMRPFPFNGSFSFVVRSVSIVSGNNTFRIVARDKVYGLDGYSLWAASFAFPYEDEIDLDDTDGVAGPDRVREPTVVERPQFVTGGSGGELFLYCLALPRSASNAEDACLICDNGGGLMFQAIEGTEYLMPVWPGTTTPALFTLRPTMAIQAKVPAWPKVVYALESLPAVVSASPNHRFLYGFGHGLGFEGFDIVFDPDHVIKGGVRLSKSLGTLQFSVRLADAKRASLRCEFEVDYFAPSVSSGLSSPDSMAGLWWHLASLFRTSDPRAEDVCFALLVGKLDEVGLEGISIEDWRGYFYMCFAEMMEELIKDGINESEVVQGYRLGRAVGDALRPHVDPSLPERLADIGMAAFLLRLAKMPYFHPEGRAGMALKKQVGLIQFLKGIFSKNG